MSERKIWTGKCICHGMIVTGPPALSRPNPYFPVALYGRSSRCWMLITESGIHDVPVAEATEATDD